MNLSIVMMKQRAICVVISASRDNWNLAKADTIHYRYSSCSELKEHQREKKKKKSNHAATE